MEKPGGKPGQTWPPCTAEEEERLREWAGKVTPAEIAARLGRTVLEVRQHASEAGIRLRVRRTRA